MIRIPKPFNAVGFHNRNGNHGKKFRGPLKIEEVIPYVGVDDVRFGMTPAEVAQIWGGAPQPFGEFLKAVCEVQRQCIDNVLIRKPAH